MLSYISSKLNYLWEMWDSVCCLWWPAATQSVRRGDRLNSFNKDQCMSWWVREAFRKMRFGSADVTEQCMITHSSLVPVHSHMGQNAIPARIGDTLPFHHRAVHDNIIFYWSLWRNSLLIGPLLNKVRGQGRPQSSCVFLKETLGYNWWCLHRKRMTLVEGLQ